MSVHSAEMLVYPLNSVWISANAGSGKTRALVDRVLRLLIAGVLPERIVCITYTKAAAAEMQARIIANLRDLLVMGDAACAEKLAELLGRAPRAEEIQRARNLFASVLDSPFGGVQLTTIHGFCQQILRKFPLEAGISPQFTVLEDAAREQFRRMARQRLFELAEASPLSEALSILAERSGEARITDLLDAIENQSAEWDAALAGASPEHARTLIYQHLDVSPEIDAEAMRADFIAQLLTQSEANQLRGALPEFLNHKNKGEQKLGNLFAEWLESAGDAAAQSPLLDALLDHFVTEKLTPHTRAFSKTAPLPELLDRIRSKCVSYCQQRAALACAEESAALVVLAAAMRDLVRQLKFQHQAYDYADLITLTRALLTTRAMIGWVMRKLDHRIDHVLIDEAQDTSPDQWAIARALVDELIAANAGVGSGEVPRSLLVVGDEKQSIFGFQGAAPEAFAREYQAFAHLLSESAAPLARAQLRISYRSAKAVLDVVDAVAAQPSVAAALASDGAIAAHALYRTQAVGSVTIYPLVIAEEKPAPEPFSMPTDYTQTQSASQKLANQIAADIADWLAHGRLLHSLARPIKPADILILVHRRQPMVPCLIRALEAEKVPVAGIDRLMLSRHLAVRDVLALMAWCMQPDCDLALAQVLRSPIIGMSDEALRALAFGRAGSLWNAVRAHQHAIADSLEKLNDVAGLPPYEFLTQLLEVQGARRKFATRFGEEVHEILDELKSQAAQMPAGMVPSLAYFHDWLSRSERIIKREAEAAGDHVRIMTVHGAKGLEAPVVILADTMRVPDLRKELVYFSSNDAADSGRTFPLIALSDAAKCTPAMAGAKAARKAALLAEYQRLLYVALTRAREELHVVGAGSNPLKMADALAVAEVTCWYETIRAAMESLGAATLPDGALQWRDAPPAASPEALKASVSADLTTSLPDWLHRMPVAVKRPNVPLAPSQLSRGDIQSSRVDKAARGVVIHRVLQALRAQSDAAHVRALVHLFAPEWDVEAQRAVTEEIGALHVREHWLWEYPSQSEVSIAGTLSMDGVAQPIAGQIDRLVEMPDAWVIVDYKTGAANAEISANYLLQLKCYQALLRQVYADKPIRVGLLWTATPQFVWLDAEVARTAWPQNLSKN